MPKHASKVAFKEGGGAVAKRGSVARVEEVMEEAEGEEAEEEARVLLDGADVFLMKTLCEHASSALQVRASRTHTHSVRIPCSRP